MVAYLLVSPCAFWMSVSKPAASRPSCRYGRSLFSQRGDDAASGRMTQARAAAASAVSVDPPPPPPLEQPASSSAEIPANAAADTNEDLFIVLPILLVKSTPEGGRRRQ